MGIPCIPRFCSHVQNATRAGLTMTSVPNTKYNLNLAIALHRAGYISSVTRGGPTPPDPETITTAVPEPVTYKNVSTRRLWLGLKYWNDKPVMSNLKSMSSSKRWVTASLSELHRLARGLEANQIPGLNLGESLFLTTDIGVLESREAIEKRRGGLLLCRVS
ncbi:hypothetical protein TD95_003150 [Thielaviopsis punctulata]|uniref:Ribosomal protein S8 n=1 Tax=Thielaviopsis punctulata TaxID=72032 RepID=A0A0F4ZAA4_9PEZI|nr:hypothetical protein TD95_003150 [Thielaviopsis punctulata]